MNKRVSIVIYLLIVSVFGAYCQQNGQIFQMINVSVPDSVVFTLSKDVMIEGVDVFLVSGEQIFKGVSMGSGEMSFRNDKLYITDKTIITTKDFSVPKDFNAQKIKFDTGDKVLYYNLIDKAWE